MYDNAFRFRDSTVSVVWVVLCRFWQSLRDCTTSSTFNSFGTHTLRFVRFCEDWNPVAWKFNELWEFRSRRCRRRLSQSNTRWTTLDEIYQISILLQSSNRKKSTIFRFSKHVFKRILTRCKCLQFSYRCSILWTTYLGKYIFQISSKMPNYPDFQNFSMTIHYW